MIVWIVEYVAYSGSRQVKLITSDRKTAKKYVRDQDIPARYHEIIPWEVIP